MLSENKYSYKSYSMKLKALQVIHFPKKIHKMDMGALQEKYNEHYSIEKNNANAIELSNEAIILDVEAFKLFEDFIKL